MNITPVDTTAERDAARLTPTMRSALVAIARQGGGHPATVGAATMQALRSRRLIMGVILTSHGEDVLAALAAGGAPTEQYLAQDDGATRPTFPRCGICGGWHGQPDEASHLAGGAQ